MELQYFPEEILTKILSYLEQKILHLKVALVCKRFLGLTRSSQLFKCVKFVNWSDDPSSKKDSLIDMIGRNKNLESFIYWSPEHCVLDILKVVAKNGQQLK
jgi:hypothetical protein